MYSLSKYSLSKLNQMEQAEFVEALGTTFEQTPTIAAQAWHYRPFDSVTDLHRAMLKVVEQMSPPEKLALVCAHPDLGSKAKMAAASVKEQSGAGLDQLSAAEFEHLLYLNQTYRHKFGFPFILAVKHHTKASILATFEQRLRHDPATEIQQALAEIGQIARFRLEAVVC
jgi:2-oxo-4-hydroxy-4-carboxy-5-ureidoimidazoline decarboxylase